MRPAGHEERRPGDDADRNESQTETARSKQCDIGCADCNAMGEQAHVGGCPVGAGLVRAVADDQAWFQRRPGATYTRRTSWAERQHTTVLFGLDQDEVAEWTVVYGPAPGVRLRAIGHACYVDVDPGIGPESLAALTRIVGMPLPPTIGTVSTQGVLTMHYRSDRLGVAS